MHNKQNLREITIRNILKIRNIKTYRLKIKSKLLTRGLGNNL